MCECFTPDTAFYVFGRSSFPLCANALRLIPRFMCLDGIFSGYVSLLYAGYRVVCIRNVFLGMTPSLFDDTVTVLRMFCPVVRLPRLFGTVYRDV
jgi:hypothetical protein